MDASSKKVFCVLFIIHVLRQIFLFSVNIEESGPPRKRDKVEPDKKKVIPEKRNRENGEKATDDYHYEKFKKQFRRY